jgi:hypothetical protein
MTPTRLLVRIVGPHVLVGRVVAGYAVGALPFLHGPDLVDLPLGAETAGSETFAVVVLCEALVTTRPPVDEFLAHGELFLDVG